MSANTEPMTPDAFDRMTRKSMDEVIRFMVEGIHESKINESDIDFFIKPTEDI